MTKQEKIKLAQGDLRHAQIKHGLSLQRAAPLADAYTDLDRQRRRGLESDGYEWAEVALAEAQWRLFHAQADVSRAEAAACLSRVAATYSELLAAERRLAAVMEE